MHAWHFCKEAAFAVSKNPSSIFMGIHFYNFRDKGVRTRLEYITVFYKRNSPKNLYVKKSPKKTLKENDRFF